MRLRFFAAPVLATAAMAVLACLPKTEPEAWHLGGATGNTSPAASPGEPGETVIPCPAARVEDLAAAIVGALRRGDEAAFDACIATEEDMQTLGAAAKS